MWRFWTVALCAALLMGCSTLGVEAPREAGWVTTPPVVDGTCDEYVGRLQLPLTTAKGEPLGQAFVLHDKRFIYICLDEVQPDDRGRPVQVRVATGGAGDHPMDATTVDIKVDPAVSGVTVTRPAPAGAAPVVKVSSDDVQVAHAAGDIEFRLTLEWLGGHGRTVGLWLGVSDTAGDTLASWPKGGKPDAPGSWGEITLGPVYPETITAGSLHLDGRGYATIPHLPALNPAETFTIEVWARIVDGDCGTLLGSGIDTSFWLGVCGSVGFSHRGVAAIRWGQTRVDDDAWHHIALVFRENGERVLYVDGRVELRLGHHWYPEQAAEHDAVRAGPADSWLRVGSDPDIPSRLDRLRAYVRDLRIWALPRDRDAIVATAFAELRPGSESGRGLLASWPFTRNLRDEVAGNDAGLVGHVALARAERTVRAFPADLEPRHIVDVPPREPQLEFAGVLPFAPERKIVNDASCNAIEYDKRGRIRLEPGRYQSVFAQVTDGQLAVCLPGFFGGNGPNDGVTLWVRNESQTGIGHQLKPTYRFDLDAAGRLLAAVWDPGTGGFSDSPEASALINHAFATEKTFKPHNDTRQIDAQWWRSELVFDRRLLGPLDAGTELAIGVEARAARPDRAADDETVLTYRWPEQFEPLVPATWGEVVFTAKEDVRFERMPDFSESLSTLCNEEVPPAWPRQAPTEDDFDEMCDCAAAALCCDMECKWPRVDEANHAIVFAEGVLNAVDVSDQDAHGIHDTHDVDMKVGLDPEYRWLALGGDGNLVVEWEQGSFPPHFFGRTQQARPAVKDHVSIVGEWIYDCGHNPKTEIHPAVYFASDRLETRRTGWDTAQLVRTVRVWMNYHAGEGYIPMYMTQPFTFRVEVPPGTGQPFVRVESKPGDDFGLVSATYLECADKVEITVVPFSERNQYYYEMIVGRAVHSQGPAPPAVRVEFHDLHMIDHQDGVEPHGEWFMDANVNGIWHNILWDHDIEDDEHVTPHDSRVFHVLVKPDTFDVHINSWEEDDDIDALDVGDTVLFGPDSVDGPTIANGILSGTHAIATKASDDEAAWTIHYTWEPVSGDLDALERTSNVHATVPEAHEYMYAGEPDSATPVRKLHAGDDPATLVQDGFLFQQGLNAYLPEYHVFGADIDYWRLAFDEFTTLELDGSPTQLTYSAAARSQPYVTDWSSCPYVPPSLLSKLGSKQYHVSVSADHTSDLFGIYALDISYEKATLPPDDGEPFDTGDGRPSDVTGPGATSQDLALSLSLCDAAELVPATSAPGNVSKLVKRQRWVSPWAWQETLDDTDIYEIRFPRTAFDANPDADICRSFCGSSGFHHGTLALRAPGVQMRVIAPEAGIDTTVDGDTGLLIQDLASAYPALSDTFRGTATVRVEITARDPERCVYQVEAIWTDSASVKFGDPGCPWESAGATADCILDCSRLVQVSELPEWWWTKGPGLGDPAPFEEVVALHEGRGFIEVNVPEESEFTVILSSGSTAAMTADLFDSDGVLIAVGRTLGEDAAESVPAAGQVARARIASDGKIAAGTYLLHVYDSADPNESDVASSAAVGLAAGSR